MDESDIDAIRRAIDAFMFVHRRRPFGALREIAVQAELKRLADDFLRGRNFVMATVITEPTRRRVVQWRAETVQETDRVRLEAKILLPGETEKKNDTRHDRTDLILYRNSNVRIFRHSGGPGDVVYKTEPQSVLVAVEIKASPSHRLDQKRSYAADIRRLLNLKIREKIAGFFLVLDKSSQLYALGRVPWPNMNRIQWCDEEREAKALTEIVYQGHNANVTETWDEIWICPSLPDGEENFIEIFDVSADEGAPYHFFAFWRPSNESAVWR